MGICAEAIVAHVPCHPATCDVIIVYASALYMAASFVCAAWHCGCDEHACPSRPPADESSCGAQAVTGRQPPSQQAGNLEVLLPLSHVQDVLFLLRTGERLGLECHVFV